MVSEIILSAANLVDKVKNVVLKLFEKGGQTYMRFLYVRWDFCLVKAGLNMYYVRLNALHFEHVLR